MMRTATGALISRCMVLCISVLLLTASLPSRAQQAAATSGRTAGTQSPEAEDPKICKRVVPTGSRIPRRYCLHKSEWDAMREGGQKAARDAFALESQYGYDGSPSGS